ncbi:response regulator [Polaromonas sp. YR568]|uniref:response regulator n=1 Tax=Polaromonas sp. YR568 TaxID=1855301 RepID=UPI00398BE32B
MVINAFLVEDKPDIRKTLVEAMEEIAPLRFVGHADSETGARLWLHDHEDWDLAIVDLFLAEGSGFGVLKDCQQRKPGQKVVVLTSHSQENILLRCRELGADEVFDKSEDVEKLVLFCQQHASSLDGVLPPPQ